MCPDAVTHQHRNVGILSIQGDQFQIAEIPLKTVRPFELDEVFLADEAANADNKINLEDKDTITRFLREKVCIVTTTRLTPQVEELILAAQTTWLETHDPKKEEMMLPLIRLKVGYKASFLSPHRSRPLARRR